MTATATKEKTATTEAPAPKEWVMPYVELGMRVLWYGDGSRNQKPDIGIVTAVENSAVALHVLVRGGGWHNRDGVRHVDDPKRVEADNEEGTWEHTPFTKSVMEAVGVGF